MAHSPSVNEYGREWEEFDSYRIFALPPVANCSYAVCDANGAPLCGKYVPGTGKQEFTLDNWHTQPTNKSKGQE